MAPSDVTGKNLASPNPSVNRPDHGLSLGKISATFIDVKFNFISFFNRTQINKAYVNKLTI